MQSLKTLDEVPEINQDKFKAVLERVSLFIYDANNYAKAAEMAALYTSTIEEDDNAEMAALKIREDHAALYTSTIEEDDNAEKDIKSSENKPPIDDFWFLVGQPTKEKEIAGEVWIPPASLNGSDDDFS